MTNDGHFRDVHRGKRKRWKPRHARGGGQSSWWSS